MLTPLTVLYMLHRMLQPTADVASYLTPLTGINKELLDEHGMPLEEALGAPPALDSTAHLRPRSTRHAFV